MAEGASASVLLQRLAGTWTCQTGFIYRVSPDDSAGQACLDVKYTKRNGQTSITKVFIRGNNEVFWDQGYVLEADPVQPDKMHWVSSRQRNRAFEWSRLEYFDPATVGQAARRVSLSFSDEEDAVTGPSSRRNSGSTADTMGFRSRTSKTRRYTMSPRASPYQSPRRQSVEDTCNFSNLTSSSDQERLSLREATMNLREATMSLKQTYQDQRGFDTSANQRMSMVKELAQLVHEVSTLEQKRDEEKSTLKRYRMEQGVLKKRMRRCREVVEKTVGSIDEIFSEATAHAGEPADSQTMRRIRRNAEEAEAEANALLATWDAAGSEEGTEEGSPEPEQGGSQTVAPSGRQGSAVNCFDVGVSRTPSRHPDRRRGPLKSFQ